MNLFYLIDVSICKNDLLFISQNAKRTKKRKRMEEIVENERREDINLFLMIVVIMLRLLFFTWIGSKLFYPDEHEKINDILYLSKDLIKFIS